MHDCVYDITCKTDAGPTGSNRLQQDLTAPNHKHNEEFLLLPGHREPMEIGPFTCDIISLWLSDWQCALKIY